MPSDLKTDWETVCITLYDSHCLYIASPVTAILPFQCGTVSFPHYITLSVCCSFSNGTPKTKPCLVKRMSDEMSSPPSGCEARTQPMSSPIAKNKLQRSLNTGQCGSPSSRTEGENIFPGPRNPLPVYFVQRNVRSIRLSIYQSHWIWKTRKNEKTSRERMGETCGNPDHFASQN